LLIFSWLFITAISGMIIYIISLNRWVFAFLFPVFVISTGIVSFYVGQYNLVFNSAVVESTLYTNNYEAFSQISFFLLGYISVLLLISSFFVFRRFGLKKPKVDWVSFMIVLLGLLAIFANDKQRVLSTFYYSPYAFFFGIDKSLVADIPSPQKRVDVSAGAVCHSDSLIVVFVAGEAMRADHLSLNGYSRKTFPLMEKENPVSFKRIYSEWSYTIKSLPQIFTRADSVNHWPLVNEKTFISIFNTCGYQSWWIGNQDLNKFLKPLSDECDTVQLFSYTRDGKRYDGNMLPAIRHAVDSDDPKKLIVVHQFGCHWWYPSNCPREFEKFKPVMKTKNISRYDSLKIVNSYDNTACYTDFFLSEIVKMLKDKKAILIYLSDHGELLGEDGKWIHAQQTDFEKNPACIIWFSDEYARRYPEKVKSAQQNKDNHFRTDFLFHSILDAGDICAPVRVDALDLFNQYH
ncbi:MAG TPA: sulfatase-like hydrolase/transferase, partial [Prolixibacteraceae bacterium]|nr:sulfatase-like hydrolase/transferase [Prolixibacteraceae bacterium]